MIQDCSSLKIDQECSAICIVRWVTHRAGSFKHTFINSQQYVRSWTERNDCNILASLERKGPRLVAASVRIAYRGTNEYVLCELEYRDSISDWTEHRISVAGKEHISLSVDRSAEVRKLLRRT